MSPEVARYFLDLSLPRVDQRRIRELSEKANEGELVGEEQNELEMYILLSDFLAIVQSKARLALKKKSPAA